MNEQGRLFLKEISKIADMSSRSGTSVMERIINDQLYKNREMMAEFYKKAPGSAKFFIDSVPGYHLTKEEVLVVIEREPAYIELFWPLENGGENDIRKNILQEALSIHGCALAGIQHFNQDDDLVRTAIEQNGHALKYAAPSYLDNPNSVRMAMLNSPSAYQFASTR